jgi:prepilin peptidase CpaA
MQGYAVAQVVAVLGLVTVAAVTDLRSHRIPNLVTIPALALGLVLSTLAGGLHGLGQSLAGMGLALGVFVLSLLCGGGIGGGDVKLLGAVGALGGAAFLLQSLVVAVLVGGVMALGLALLRGRLGEVVARCWRWMVLRASLHASVPLGTDDPTLKLPYALPIALGVLACVLRPVVGL